MGQGFGSPSTMIAIGLEGSANKLGVGIIRDRVILANVRVTFVTPPGTGFLPGETARHHRQHVVGLIKKALHSASIRLSEIDCVCFTKGEFALWLFRDLCQFISCLLDSKTVFLHFIALHFMVI